MAARRWRCFEKSGPGLPPEIQAEAGPVMGRMIDETKSRGARMGRFLAGERRKEKSRSGRRPGGRAQRGNPGPMANDFANIADGVHRFRRSRLRARPE